MAKIERGSPGRKFKQTSNRTNQQRYDLWIQKRERRDRRKEWLPEIGIVGGEGGRNPNCGNGELGKRSNTFRLLFFIGHGADAVRRGAGPARVRREPPSIG